MNRRVLAWALAGTGAVLVLAGPPVRLIVPDAPLYGGGTEGIGGQIVRTLQSLSFLAFPLVGGLIALRRPNSAIGWLILAFSLWTGVIQVVRAYAVYALYGAVPPAPGADWAVWVQRWGVVPLEVMLGLMLLIFPSGAPASRRWWILVPTAFAGALLAMTGGALSRAAVPDFPDVANPISADAPWVAAAALVGNVLIAGSVVGAACSIIARFRRAMGVERQQLKWIAYAGAIAIVLFVPGTLVYSYSQERIPLAVGVLFLAPLIAIPVAFGVAILHYRLYDIDLLINRTLVYGATTAMIGAAFFGGIVVMQTVLRPLTGGSELAVAITTLACFALFQPMRRRIQSVVDRRFYRSRYDAGRTLDAFSVRLRDEVDLEAIRAELLDAVAGTVQPASASVWLRGTR